MAQIDRSFIGEGIPYARLYQTQDPLLDIGNCDAANISFTTDRQALPNFRGGGGNRNVRERVTDAAVTVGFYDLTDTNLARVTRSTITTVAAGVVTAEPRVCAGVEGELIPFKHLPDLREQVTVVTAADGPLQPGIDYLQTPHGVIVTAGSSIDDTGVKVTYTKLKSSAVQLLNGGQVELEIFIAGLNDAQTGEPFSVHLKRVKFGLISEMPVLGQEYLRLEAPGELLVDPLVIGDEFSKFAEFNLVSKAA